ncbi:MAG: hypothetical protein M3O22_08445 [Pseudomonadota bacterium]|nr:hypothetical protein [Pseudomonadota bacterium]
MPEEKIHFANPWPGAPVEDLAWLIHDSCGNGDWSATKSFLSLKGEQGMLLFRLAFAESENCRQQFDAMVQNPQGWDIFCRIFRESAAVWILDASTFGDALPPESPRTQNQVAGLRRLMGALGRAVGFLELGYPDMESDAKPAC